MSIKIKRYVIGSIIITAFSSFYSVVKLQTDIYNFNLPKMSESKKVQVYENTGIYSLHIFQMCLFLSKGKVWKMRVLDCLHIRSQGPCKLRPSIVSSSLNRSVLG